MATRLEIDAVSDKSGVRVGLDFRLVKLLGCNEHKIGLRQQHTFQLGQRRCRDAGKSTVLIDAVINERLLA